MPRPLSEVYALVKKATVAIVTSHSDRLPKRPFSIIGSGFCIHRKGVIVTCEHVWRSFVDPEGYQRMRARCGRPQPWHRAIASALSVVRAL